MRTATDTAIIVLSWNGADILPACLDSLLAQEADFDIIVVDNGSTDSSKKVIESYGEKITPLFNDRNLGFAGGVNTGIRYALDKNYKYIGLLNNDAVAEPGWVKGLRSAFVKDNKIGAATSTIVHSRDDTYDSTGDFYTVWGLAYPRGRDEEMSGKYDKHTEIMAASGGASMFRSDMFIDVGLFDEDFFAYYEDVDLGLRAMGRGWKAVFVPAASVLHATGSTSKKMPSFGTYQALKNQPFLLIKNIPSPLFWKILPRFFVAYSAFSLRTLLNGKPLTLAKGWFMVLRLLPKKLGARRAIIKSATPEGLDMLKRTIVRDVPPNTRTLERLQKFIQKFWPSFK